jgi:hypothetical protein
MGSVAGLYDLEKKKILLHCWESGNWTMIPQVNPQPYKMDIVQYMEFRNVM